MDFLNKYGMSPESIDPVSYAPAMLEDMRRGLAGEQSDMAMIPTYLKNDGVVPLNVPAVVIDAGGTNFRRALVTFTEAGCVVSELKKCPMPGIEAPVDWDEFIAFVADEIEPLMDRADKIGFCFSYTAEVTPDIDGRVVRIDKEVTVRGCEGQLVGASLIKELERRGIHGKSAVILNDTVAVLLGGSAVLDKTAYSGFFGQVSGTGTNTCCAVPYRDIKKLGRDEPGEILVNLECGMYAGLPRGKFDLLLDAQSKDPGHKFFEKMTAGVYLGELTRLMLLQAAEDGLLSAHCAGRVRELNRIDSAVIDAWASGEGMEALCAAPDDAELIKTLCLAMFERSARCMCSCIGGMLLLTGAGQSEDKPACVCAEGSLVQKSRHYRPMLGRLLKDDIGGRLGRYAVLKVGEETTLPGSAAAALLNR